MIPINSNRKRNSISVWYLDILKARDVLNHPSIFYLLSLNQLPLTVKHQNAVLKNRWTEHMTPEHENTGPSLPRQWQTPTGAEERALTQCCTSQVQPLRDSLRQTESSLIRKAMRSDVYCSRTENCVCAFNHWTELVTYRLQLRHNNGIWVKDATGKRAFWVWKKKNVREKYFPFVQLFHSLLYQSRFLNVVNVLVAKHS